MLGFNSRSRVKRSERLAWKFAATGVALGLVEATLLPRQGRGGHVIVGANLIQSFNDDIMSEDPIDLFQHRTSLNI